MKTIQQLRQIYEQIKVPKDAALLEFEGVEGKDVYNCSIPFESGGKTYILGRVEKRNEWASSVSKLFEKKDDGKWHKVNEFDPLPIEDPFCVQINGEIVVGGTHVLKERGLVKTYYGYFYRGKDIFSLRYFTTGPEYMKDIRLVQLPEGRIGVFSRPRSDEIKEKYGSESLVGFTVLNSLDELDSDSINAAKYIDGLFCKDEWGGVNQAFYLGDGLVGAIGHQGYRYFNEAGEHAVYLNMAYVFNINTRELLEKKVIGQRSDYPESSYKVPGLKDCAFTSGIVFRKDGRAELYSGLGDTSEGKIVIENPFRVEMAMAQ